MRRKIEVLAIGLMATMMISSMATIGYCDDIEEQGLSDLTVTKVEVRCGPMEETWLVTVTVWNLNDRPAYGPFSTDIFLDNITGGYWQFLYEKVHTVGIPGHWFVVIPYVFHLHTGEEGMPFKCVAVTDYYHQVTETDETNNVGESEEFTA